MVNAILLLAISDHTKICLFGVQTCMKPSLAVKNLSCLLRVLIVSIGSASSQIKSFVRHSRALQATIPSPLHWGNCWKMPCFQCRQSEQDSMLQFPYQEILTSTMQCPHKMSPSYDEYLLVSRILTHTSGVFYFWIDVLVSEKIAMSPGPVPDGGLR